MFISPVSLIVSLVALKVCTKKTWAILGVILGGIETLIVLVILVCVLLFAK